MDDQHRKNDKSQSKADTSGNRQPESFDYRDEWMFGATQSKIGGKRNPQKPHNRQTHNAQNHNPNNQA
ncbi:MAG TPA: hypothetical protein VN633_19225 [Bryobacteraceae bacterium]|nr:hypothetical protein [Bryobacteraceae bacterium]